MASSFGVDRIYTDAADMLKSETLDFVDVATTAQSHRQLVCLALAHGAATICQKPFAETVADARFMVLAAQDAGRPLMVHENFRWQRPFRILKQRIAAGDIGHPYLRAYQLPARVRQLSQSALPRRAGTVFHHGCGIAFVRSRALADG